MNRFLHIKYTPTSRRGLTWPRPGDLAGLSHRITWKQPSPLCFSYRSIASDLALALQSLPTVDKKHPPPGCKVTLNLQSKNIRATAKPPSIIQQGCLQALHFPQQLCLARDRSDSVITDPVVGNYCKAWEWENYPAYQILGNQRRVVFTHGIIEAWCKTEQTGFHLLYVEYKD